MLPRLRKQRVSSAESRLMSLPSLHRLRRLLRPSSKRSQCPPTLRCTTSTQFQRAELPSTTCVSSCLTRVTAILLIPFPQHAHTHTGLGP
jgi:hypothetical protein